MRVPAWVAAAVLVLPAAVSAAPALDTPAESPSARTITGELTRVDLARRSVVVKTDGRDARETEAVVRSETRVVSRGRATRLEDLRPGDRVVVVTTGDGGKRLARMIKVVGRAAPALPPPSPTTPSPAVSPSGVAGGSAG